MGPFHFRYRICTSHHEFHKNKRWVGLLSNWCFSILCLYAFYFFTNSGKINNIQFYFHPVDLLCSFCHQQWFHQTPPPVWRRSRCFWRCSGCGSPPCHLPGWWSPSAWSRSQPAWWQSQHLIGTRGGTYDRDQPILQSIPRIFCVFSTESCLIGLN